MHEQGLRETYTTTSPTVQSNRRRNVRLPESTATSDPRDEAHRLSNYLPPLTTTKKPFSFFMTFGSNDMTNIFDPKRKTEEEKFSEEKRSTTDGGGLYDIREPCDYPHATSKFPFGGLNFGDTNLHNPFIPSKDSKDDSFNNFFKNKEDNPLLRGGIVIGSMPFGSTTTEKYEKKTTEKPVNKAKYWCTKYQAACNENDDSELKPRIIGGKPASPRKHTHMVMIGYGGADDKHWLCGGSLISTNYVLSAAHCTTTGKWGKPKWARMGDLDLSTRTEDARPQERMIIEHHNHPQYREPAVYHDIAIYKLNNDVSMTDWVSPICLHTSSEYPGSEVIVTGWGRTDFVSETSPVLMEVEIGLYNDSECKKLMDKTGGNKLPRGIDSRIMICAGVSQGGKDACSGDSGGPLIIQTSKCSKLQIGITSIGRDCGLPNSPGVYTRISHYIPWIESVVWS
ncbi:clotting factor G beta subunit-like isoform X2 [Rhodnius prolixus]